MHQNPLDQDTIERERLEFSYPPAPDAQEQIRRDNGLTRELRFVDEQQPLLDFEANQTADKLLSIRALCSSR